MRVAAHLRIPFKEIDLSAAYKAKVFEHSLQEFTRGHTPNPDTLCNREIKFGLLYQYAREHGAEYIATGHYAQTKAGELYTSVDLEKDQSYFLWMVPEDHIAHTFFPVGGMHKHEVRALAKKYGLPNAARQDSQGLCFLGDLSTRHMLIKELAPNPGEVLSEEGRVIGVHEGAILYTLGQRHGFTVVNTPTQEPLYVIAKDLSKNTITVSIQKFPTQAQGVRLELSATNLIGKVTPGPCMARYRYRQTRISASILSVEEKVVVELHTAHYVPLGQSLVLYATHTGGIGTRCMGGGVVESATLV